MGCSPNGSSSRKIHGTWLSLWQKDIRLELTFQENERFKVVLQRTGQVHTNLGWYKAEDGILAIRDSVDYPLPVCNLADTGRYQFQVNNDTLQFKLVDDKCERRSYALQLERFVRISN
ncbi:MAG: hypothetical protein ACTHMC_23135 [Pseudobacter sp.]|uniref:hypothetical protein n=1 Tax=Pseudobacter sp. TaxID=2045420 RepID=UPI003F8092FF